MRLVQAQMAVVFAKYEVHHYWDSAMLAMRRDSGSPGSEGRRSWFNAWTALSAGRIECDTSYVKRVATDAARKSRIRSGERLRKRTEGILLLLCRKRHRIGGLSGRVRVPSVRRFVMLEGLSRSRDTHAHVDHVATGTFLPVDRTQNVRSALSQKSRTIS